METAKTSSGNLAGEQAIIFREIERLRITEGFHDRVAPEFLVAIFQLHQIQKDLEAVLDNRVGLFSLQIDDKANPARVVLVAWIV